MPGISCNCNRLEQVKTSIFIAWSKRSRCWKQHSKIEPRIWTIYHKGHSMPWACGWATGCPLSIFLPQLAVLHSMSYHDVYDSVLFCLVVKMTWNKVYSISPCCIHRAVMVFIEQKDLSNANRCGEAFVLQGVHVWHWSRGIYRSGHRNSTCW